MASLFLVLVGGVFLWSGGFKALSRSAPRAARRSALANLVGEEHAPLAYRLLGAAELALAAALILPPVHAAEAVSASAAAVAFIGYLAYARTVAPDSSCGCMSARRTPVTARSFARAGLLVVLSLVAAGATQTWAGALGDRPVTGAAMLLLGTAAIIALSPEADHRWLLPLRRMRVRWRHPLAADSYDMPLESMLQQLNVSPAYRQVGGLLRSDLRDTWAEGDMQILCYTAVYEDRDATAVFAVPRKHFDPDEVRVVIVEESQIQDSSRTVSRTRARSSG